MTTRSRKTISCFLVACLLLTGIPAYGRHPANDIPRPSPAVCLVTGRTILPDAPLVIHIQDLHCNPAIQKNIVKIIDFYATLYPGCRILVEGAPQGPVNLAPLKALPDRVRAKTFDLMLEKGLMSGGEYRALADPGSRLYGLEDWKIYKEEVELFRRLFNAREGAAGELARLDRTVREAVRQKLSPRQQRLARFIVTDARDAAWYDRLPQVCAEWDVPLHTYPALVTYLRLQTLGRSLNLTRVQKQSKDFLSVLKSTIPYRDYAALLNARPGTEELFTGLAKFFSALSPEAQRAYPDLAAYLAYLGFQRGLNPVHLVRDENALADALCARACRTPAEQEAFSLARLSRLLAEAMNARLTAEGYAAYTKERPRLARYFEDNENGTRFPRITALIASGVIERYYGQNLKRDAIFSDAIAASVRENGAAPVIAVTGGFHQGLAARLKAKGISSVSVMPAAGAGPENPLYGRIMVNDLLPGDIARAALAPVLNAVGIEESRAASYTAVLTGMAEAARVDGTTSPEDLAALIREWIARCQSSTAESGDAAKLGRLTVRAEDDSCLVSGAGTTIRLPCHTPNFAEEVFQQLARIADAAGASVAQGIEHLSYRDRMRAQLLDQNRQARNVFGNPQAYRDHILEHIKIAPLSPLNGKSSVYWFPTRFCPVGCADCYFSSQLGGKHDRNRETTYDAEGVDRLIEFMDQGQTQQLTIAGGGEPLLEKATVLEVIRRANVETLIVVTSGYWGKNPANARQMLVDLYEAQATANERRGKAGLPPMKMFLRISTDQYHVKQLTLRPTINIINEFHRLYSEMPAFREANIQLYLKTLDDDPSFDELRAELQRSGQVDIEDGYKLQVKDLANVNLTGIIRFRDNFKVLVRSVPLFYADPEVDMRDLEVVRRNATIFQEKNAEKCTLDDGRIVFGGWRQKGQVVGVNWHMPYDGRVQIWGTTSPDNDSHIYRQSYREIFDQQLSDIISLAMIEKGTQFVEQIVSEVNPRSTLRAEAVNIPDWYSTIAMEDAKTRLYVTIRLLQEYYREGRAFDRQFAALPEELQDLIHRPREYLMGLYHASDYNIVDEYLEHPDRLRYVDEYGSYHAAPKSAADKLAELARLVEKGHYSDLDIARMREKIRKTRLLNGREKDLLEQILSRSGASELAVSAPDREIRSVILLTGVHGAGKTTLAARLSEETGLPFIKKGDQLRRIALSKGYTDVADYIKFLNAHPDIKRSIYGRINGEIIHAMLQGNCIIDDNLSPWLAEQIEPFLRARDIAVVRVNLRADLETRAQRIAANPREGDGDITGPGAAAGLLQARDADERTDYLREYGVNIDAIRPDITIDTSRLTIEEVFDDVYRKLHLLYDGLLKADPPKDLIPPDRNDHLNLESFTAMKAAA